MGLKEQIEADLKKAMLARDEDSKRALRAIKSLILLEETKGGSSGVLTEDEGLKILTKAAKQRRDSLEIYKAQNREDLVDVEKKDLEVIERYLPKQLTPEEIEVELVKIIEKTGAKSAAEIGKVMGMASKELAGKADGKVISEIAKKLLS